MLVPFSLLSLAGKGAVIVALRKGSISLRLKRFNFVTPLVINVDRYAAFEALLWLCRFGISRCG
ncbi:hypothetical protein EZS27_025305 [termite gut metagenome]|uniref:Uncharacterized protein n=1 Tax=termite gut metagenome TaxID=433724 RepID=A0A5J4QYI8_9ZZZZ